MCDVITAGTMRVASHREEREITLSIVRRQEASIDRVLSIQTFYRWEILFLVKRSSRSYVCDGRNFLNPPVCDGSTGIMAVLGLSNTFTDIATAINK